MADTTTTFRVNGREVTVTGPPFRRLLDVLREELKLTGSKEGCGEGECGACSAIVNGELVNTCIVPVLQAEGAVITTVEALADTPAGAAVQRAFMEHGGAQCGICTPGMIVAATWLAQQRASANHARIPAGEIREMLAGNLCRCTGYDLIVASVEAALASPDDGSSRR
ncbi:MAG TPA: (2Fe-2S)-binding protein [Candidatus Eisenbacteria bacterium]